MIRDRLIAALMVETTVALAFLGCLSCSRTDPRTDLDAHFFDAGPCDPATNTGCAEEQKCTWIRTGEDSGRTGCAPAGTAQPGASCVFGADGATTGFDTCTARHFCVDDVCRALCQLDSPSCPDAMTCAAITNAFVDAAIGACVE